MRARAISHGGARAGSGRKPHGRDVAIGERFGAAVVEEAFHKNGSSTDVAIATCEDCIAGRADAITMAKAILKHVRHSAASRRLTCDLSISDVVEIRIGKACSYCSGDIGGSPGLDRADSLFGYVLFNVRPCCARCNSEKGSMPEADYRWLIAHREANVPDWRDRRIMTQVISRLRRAQ